MQEVELVEFLAGKGVVLAVCDAIVLLGFLQVFLYAPAVLVELPYSVEGVREAAGLIEFKGPFAVFGIALGALAKDVGKVALSQIIAHFDSTLIPIYGLLNVFFNTYASLEESADSIGEVWIIEGFVVFVVRYNIKQLTNLLIGIAEVLRNVGVRKDEFAAVHGNHLDVFYFAHISVVYRFLCKDKMGVYQMSAHH
jgi:hypothetical protein